MSHWTNKIDISDVFKAIENKQMTSIVGGKEVAKRLRKLADELKLGSVLDTETKDELKDELEGIADTFEIAWDQDEFDLGLEHLYDFGDYILDDRAFPFKRMLWVNVGQFQARQNSS